MIVKVEVTRADIQAGKRGDACECPVARATKRALNREDVEVHSGGYALIGTRYYPIPEKPANFIRGFDSGLIRPATCPSFEFDLEFAG